MQKSCRKVMQHQVRSKTRFRTNFGTILGGFREAKSTQNRKKGFPKRMRKNSRFSEGLFSLAEALPESFGPPPGKSGDPGRHERRGLAYTLGLEFWLHFPGKPQFRLRGVAKIEVSKNLVFQTPLEDQRSSEIRTKVLENPDGNPDDNPGRLKRPGATPSAADSVCFASPPRLQLGCTLRGEWRIFQSGVQNRCQNLVRIITKIPCKNLAKIMDFHRKWCLGGPDRVQDHLWRTKSAREGPPKRARPQFWEANSLPRHLWRRFWGNSGPPGGPRNGENRPKIAKKGVRQADRFTKLVLGGSGGVFSCFFKNIDGIFYCFLH